MVPFVFFPNNKIFAPPFQSLCNANDKQKHKKRGDWGKLEYVIESASLGIHSINRLLT